MTGPIAAAAVAALRAALSPERVFADPEELVVFEYDGTIERGQPQVVVVPDSSEEVAAVIRIARQYDLPVVPRGAGTGLSGGAVATIGGILLVMTRMKRLLEIDIVNETVLVEPGLVNLDLSKALAPHGYYYAPDPSSQRACTIGGNVAVNAGGPHCLAHGVTTNHVIGLEVVLADGSMVWTGGHGDLPGYDLKGVIVGSEGTLCVVTRALLRIQPLPEATRTLLAIFETVAQACDAVTGLISAGLLPVAVEMIDDVVLRAVEPAFHVGYPLDAGAVLLVEFEGLEEATLAEAAKARAVFDAAGVREVRESADPAERERLWLGRKGALSALGRLAPNYYVLDGVVPRSRLPEVMESVLEVGRRYDLMIGNVFHAGDGNLHPNLLFDERIEGESGRVLDAGEEIMRICVDAGGSISGEHGVGLEKRDYMSWIFSAADLEAMLRLKTVFGAGENFNPCKAFPTSKGCGEVHSRLARSLGEDVAI